MKNAPRDPIFGIYAHIIPLTNIVYGILTSKTIKGHQRSLEVQLKCSPRDLIFGMNSHMISLTNIRGYQRSLEIKRRSILKNTLHLSPPKVTQLDR